MTEDRTPARPLSCRRLHPKLVGPVAGDFCVPAIGKAYSILGFAGGVFYVPYINVRALRKGKKT